MINIKGIINRFQDMQARPGTLEGGWCNKDSKKLHCRRFAVGFAVGKKFHGEPGLSVIYTLFKWVRPPTLTVTSRHDVKNCFPVLWPWLCEFSA